MKNLLAISFKNWYNTSQVTRFKGYWHSVKWLTFKRKVGQTLVFIGVSLGMILALYVAYQIGEHYSLENQRQRAHEIVIEKAELEHLATLELRKAQDIEEGIICAIGRRDFAKDKTDINAAWKATAFCPNDLEPEGAVMVWSVPLMESIDNSYKDNPLF